MSYGTWLYSLNMFCVAGGSRNSEERTLKTTNRFNVSCIPHSSNGVLHI